MIEAQLYVIGYCRNSEFAPIVIPTTIHWDHLCVNHVLFRLQSFSVCHNACPGVVGASPVANPEVV